MYGIDSIHIEVTASSRDLRTFMNIEKLTIKKESSTKWVRKYKIILAGESINVTTHKGKCLLEFGGLYYSKNSTEKLMLIQRLKHYFGEVNIQRLDLAIDLKLDYRHISTNIPVDFYKYSRPSWTTSYYLNSRTKNKTFTYIVYNRSYWIKNFSFPLTRIELRIEKVGIGNRKLGTCLHDRQALEKCASYFEKRLKDDLAIRYKNMPIVPDIDVLSALEAFIAFLDGDRLPYGKDLFNLARSLGIRDKALEWMKANKVTLDTLPHACKGRKSEVAKEMGISQPTLRKLLAFRRSKR